MIGGVEMPKKLENCRMSVWDSVYISRKKNTSTPFLIIIVWGETYSIKWSFSKSYPTSILGNESRPCLELLGKSHKLTFGLKKIIEFSIINLDLEVKPELEF